ncbi:MAG: M20/M25/M40 family metallo-hydrolase [Oscillochloris sp.]|nr:M20/M25/M40 family metallo-hydrolase [Oscillochloris sp.]
MPDSAESPRPDAVPTLRRPPVSAPSTPLINHLIPALRALCERPSVSGHYDDLRMLADRLAVLLRGIGMQVLVVHTTGAPVVLARRKGRSRRTLLLYHRYDTAPPGPWRDWSHEPFRLAEREGALYGRGVADSKGPLATHIAALHWLIADEGDLPCDVLLVGEGDGLIGSPHLASVLAAHPEWLSADLGLAGAGARDQQGLPICYSGSKGLLQVALSVRGSMHPLPSGFAATARNPLWRLLWAISHIKGEDEDIRIPGFYDAVDGPTRDENIALRALKLDEAARLKSWGDGEFLFGMSGVALTRAEVTLPTCNVTMISSEPAGMLHAIPQYASAMLDFQLVPQQKPQAILDLLCQHLLERGFLDIEVKCLPGGYPPTYLPLTSPALKLVAEAGAAVFGAPLQLASAGPFTMPLSLLGGADSLPIITIGMSRPDSAVLGPDEHIGVADLLRHGQLLRQVMQRLENGI